MPGFGHVGLGGSVGWADPEPGLAIAFVHNRLLTPFVLVDHAGLVATSALCRMGCRRGPQGRIRAGRRLRCTVRRSGSRCRLTGLTYQRDD